jgi:hypothetical protein
MFLYSKEKENQKIFIFIGLINKLNCPFIFPCFNGCGILEKNQRRVK